MAINTRAVYFYNTSKHLTKQGSLTYDTGTDKYTYSATEANINQGDIGTIQLVIALPPAMFSGGMPMVVTLSPKGYKSGLLSMSAATWAIIEGAVETNYQVFYITMTLFSWTFTAGKNAFMVGYLTNGAYDNLDLARYTVSNGVDNFEELEADVYAEIYDSLSSVFSDLSERVIV
ncbi:MAG: hypothetical protein M0R51_14025, partial [Clostridia bacterium]|nr:hypothetical protein [Clostridia bacterium]